MINNSYKLSLAIVFRRYYYRRGSYSLVSTLNKKKSLDKATVGIIRIAREKYFVYTVLLSMSNRFRCCGDHIDDLTNFIMDIFLFLFTILLLYLCHLLWRIRYCTSHPVLVEYNLK